MNKNRETVLIFPFDSHFAPILKYTEFVRNYSKVYLMTLPGWSLFKNDVEIIDLYNNVELIVSSDFQLTSEIDTVIFTESDNKMDFDEYIYPKFLEAIDKGKKVINLIKLNRKYLDLIEDNCKRNDVEFYNYVKIDESQVANINPDEITKKIFDINIPVVSIISTSECTDKFSCQLQLYNYIRKHDYKVCLISSRSYAEFLGFKTFPAFMFSSELAENDKVYRFNNFIKEIENEESPDIIILSLPGPILPFNQKVNYGFGITAFEVFHAIYSDLTILCVNHDYYLPKYFDEIYNTIKYRFGSEVSYINISNKQIDWIEMKNTNPNEVKFLTINDQFMKKRMNELKKISKYPIFSISCSFDVDIIFKSLLDKLTEEDNVIEII